MSQRPFHGCFLAVCFLTMPLIAWAEGDNFGSMNNFKESIGGRASGMGGAFVAAADDVSSAYWNPAGLSGMELYTYEFEVQHAFLSDQIGVNYAGYAFQVPMIGNYAITWLNYTAGGFEGRDATGNVENSFASSENALVFSYGRKVYPLLKGLSLGASLKVLYFSLGEASALGHGLDIGAQWQPILYWDHTFGLSVQNLFQRIYWRDGPADPSQAHARLGTALRFLRSEDELYFNHLISTVDLDFSENRHFNFSAGIEYWYMRGLGIRAGYNSKGFTMGASYAPEFYEIDYSYRYDLTDLGNNQHMIALLIRLK